MAARSEERSFSSAGFQKPISIYSRLPTDLNIPALCPTPELKIKSEKVVQLEEPAEERNSGTCDQRKTSILFSASHQ